jgi:hypothetical protein
VSLGLRQEHVHATSDVLLCDVPVERGKRQERERLSSVLQLTRAVRALLDVSVVGKIGNHVEGESRCGYRGGRWTLELEAEAFGHPPTGEGGYSCWPRPRRWSNASPIAASSMASSSRGRTDNGKIQRDVRETSKGKADGERQLRVDGHSHELHRLELLEAILGAFPTIATLLDSLETRKNDEGRAKTH